MSRETHFNQHKNWQVLRNFSQNKQTNLNNLESLIKGTVESIKKIFEKYPGCNDIIPNQTEYRCYTLLVNLISYELLALFQPEIIKLNPFKILLIKGGGMF